MANDRLKATIDELQKKRRVYARDYTAFLRRLQASYKPTSAMYREVGQTMHMVAGVVFHIDAIMGAQGRKARQEEIDKLFDGAKQVEERMKEYAQKYADDQRFATRINQASVDSGVTMAYLEAAGKLEEGKVKEPGLREAIMEHAPGIAETGMGFMRSAAMAAMGPMYTIGKMAWQGTSGLYKAMRDWRTGKQQKSWASRVGGMGTMGDMEDILRARGVETGSPVGAMAGPPGTIVGGTHPGAVGLKVFFDKEAYRTRWTKEVLDTLKKIAGVKPASGGSAKDIAIGAMMAQAGAFLMAFLPEIAIIAAAVLGTVAVGAAVAAFLPGFMRDVQAKSSARGPEYGATKVVGAVVAGAGAVVMPTMGPASAAISLGARVAGAKVPITDPMHFVGMAVEGMADKLLDGIKGLKDSIGQMIPKSVPVSRPSDTHKNLDPLIDDINRTD